LTFEMILLLVVLLGMATLFFTEKLPVELTAFLGLVFLVLCGYVEPSEAFSGFASPAVITMLSIFFVSTALLHTGVADVIAGRVYRVIGDRETLLVVAIMLVAGVLSAFMNNIAAVAVLLPAVASIARKTGIAPSRLFIPLSFGAILGGTTTLVGTPPNILAADLLRERGIEPFSLFAFTPVGAVLLGVGILYMITVGRWLLPKRTIADSAQRGEDLARVYHLDETLFSIRIPPGSRLDGQTLAASRFGSTAGVQVVGINRGEEKTLAPPPDTELRGRDVLLVEGPFEELRGLFRLQGVELRDPDPDQLARALDQVKCVGVGVGAGSAFEGRTLRELQFREQYHAVVVGVRRGGLLLDGDVAAATLEAGDELIALCSPGQLDGATLPADAAMEPLEPARIPDLGDHLFLLRIHDRSSLVDRSIRDSQIGERTGLTIVGIVRDGYTMLPVLPRQRIRAGDQLLVTGESEPIRNLLALGDVQLQQEVPDAGMETDDVGMVEVTPSPRSRATGHTLAQLDFRESFGLQVLAIWSKGRATHDGLGGQRIREGDALLVQGPWKRIRQLGRHADYVVLTPLAQETRRTHKAPVAIGALGLMIGMVVSGWMPIHVAAFTAATVVALLGAITMEEAYRGVEWKAVFLVAAILPVGLAIERTGAAALLSDTVTTAAGPLGPYGVLGGFVVLASVLSQCLDGAPAVVLMAPVVLPAAEQMEISTHSVMMGVALAASAAFMTPFSHKANLLVMGAGGYKVVDYLRVGTPLTLVLLALMVWLVPMFFPF
jgi:di/tricarboxylate transporter